MPIFVLQGKNPRELFYWYCHLTAHEQHFSVSALSKNAENHTCNWKRQGIPGSNDVRCEKIHHDTRDAKAVFVTQRFQGWQEPKKPKRVLLSLLPRPVSKHCSLEFNDRTNSGVQMFVNASLAVTFGFYSANWSWFDISYFGQRLNLQDQHQPEDCFSCTFQRIPAGGRDWLLIWSPVSPFVD